LKGIPEKEIENSSDTFRLQRKCKQGNNVYGLWSVGNNALGFSIERAKKHLPIGSYQACLLWGDQGFYLPHYEIVGKDILISPSLLYPGSSLPDEYYMGVVTIGEDYSALQNKGHTNFAVEAQLKEIIDISIEDDFYDSPGGVNFFRGMIAAGLRVN